jgi:uncharacterized membrane protein
MRSAKIYISIPYHENVSNIPIAFTAAILTAILYIAIYINFLKFLTLLSQSANNVDKIYKKPLPSFFTLRPSLITQNAQGVLLHTRHIRIQHNKP